MDQIKMKLQTLSDEMLCGVIREISSDFRDDADVVFSLALTELESRWESAKFIGFCDSL